MKKAKRIGKKAAIIAIPLIIIGAIAGKFIYDYFQDQAEYEQDLQNYAFAQTLMDRKDYEAAERQFKSLGDFQDSAKKAEEAGKRADEQKYNDAVKALNGGRSADAYEAFSALKDYKDSEKLKDTASLQNRLDTFPSSRSYFVANKDDYPLVGVNEGAMVLLGTWIYCAPTAGEHWRLTLNADGSGSETELDIRWAFDAQGFRYTYGSDDALLDVSDELGNELRKITDGVYGIFFKDDSDEMALLISTGSDWGKRYEAAYEFYY